MKIELRETIKKGEGVFATSTFQTGDTVLTGIISERLEKNHSHASQVGGNEYVFHAGLTSKFNHSCDPNCGIKVNSTGAHDFIAIKNINKNDEVTFDYAMRNYSIDYFPKDCSCGSKDCRGKISGWKSLSEQKKEEYKNFAAPYLLKLDLKLKVNSF